MKKTYSIVYEIFTGNLSKSTNIKMLYNIIINISIIK